MALISRTTVNALVDDSGGATPDGTIWSKARVVQIYDDVDAVIAKNNSTPYNVLALTNGRNDNVAVGGTGWVGGITGVSAAFSISGIVPPLTSSGTPLDGQHLVIFKDTAQVLTILNNSTFSSAGNKILCPGGVDTATAASNYGIVWLRYNSYYLAWIVIIIR